MEDSWLRRCINNCWILQHWFLCDLIGSFVAACGADWPGQEKVGSENHLALEGCSCWAEWCAQLATSEKWCLTPSVAMDTCSSEGCAPSHLACYERHVGHSYYVHLWINIYLYSQFGIITCQCKTNRTQTSLPSPSPGCLKYLYSCWMPARGGRCCWGVRGAGCRAAGGLMGLWQVQLPL